MHPPPLLQTPAARKRRIAISALGNIADRLVAAEALLAAEGCLSEEWLDVWQALWRSRLTRGSVTSLSTLMYAAALQANLVGGAADVISRRGFLQRAEADKCWLDLAKPGDRVVVLRTGQLLHLKRCVRVRVRVRLSLHYEMQQMLPSHATQASAHRPFFLAGAGRSWACRAYSSSRNSRRRMCAATACLCSGMIGRGTSCWSRRSSLWSTAQCTAWCAASTPRTALTWSQATQTTPQSSTLWPGSS